MTEKEKLENISILMTIRDECHYLEMHHHGLVNAIGFAINAPENMANFIKGVQVVKSCLNPRSFIVMSITSVIERIRHSKYILPKLKPFLQITEELLSWANILYGCVTSTTPVGAADSAVSASLKLMRYHYLGKEEKTRLLMNNYLETWKQYHRYAQEAENLLMSEIALLKDPLIKGTLENFRYS